MLVLARKVSERIRIPSINMTITVKRVAGDVVRLGIDAPKDVIVLREEVPNKITEAPLTEQLKEQREQKHDLRNKLHGARVGMALLQKQLEMGAPPDELQETIWRIENSFVEEPSSELNGGRVSALLVEDSANEREMLASLLQLSGFDVVSANSGEEAMRYLEQSQVKPDVMLLDMGLPKMDGEEVVTKVRSNPNNESMKIFVISGRDKQDIGVDQWFHKPLNATELLSNLSSLRKVG